MIDGHFKALIAHDVKGIAAGYTDDAQALSPNWGKIIKESDYFDHVAFLRRVGFFDQK